MRRAEMDPGDEPLDGRYRLERPLGGSDQPRSWQATDVFLNRPVAIHFLPTSPSEARRQSDAARRLSRLTDDRLVEVLDLVAEPGFIATEWVTGTSLAELDERGLLTADTAVELIAEAAEALATAHAAGLYHGHIDGRSIVWSDSGLVKLIGLCLRTSADIASTGHLAHHDTRALRRILGAALAGTRHSRRLQRVVRRPCNAAVELAEALAPFRPDESPLRQRLVSAEPANAPPQVTARFTREVMDTDIITVSEDTPANELSAILARSHCAAVPVVDAAGHVTGLVSASDLARLESDDTVADQPSSRQVS